MNERNILLTTEYKNRIWYLNTYESLIKKSLNRGLNKELLNYYTELHHILPRCQGGTNKKCNLVLLTAREHIIAHMLLSCMYPDDINLCLSIIRMATGSKNSQKMPVSTRLISYFREKSALLQKGKILSKSTRKKISKSKLISKGIDPDSKSIVCFDIDYTVIKIYEYQEEVLEDGFSSSRIRMALNKKQYCASGYLWDYLVNFEKEHSKEIEEYFKKVKEGNAPIIDRSKERKKYMRRQSFLINNVSKNFSNGQKNKKSSINKNNSKKSVNKGSKNFQSRKIIGPDGTIYESITECAKKNNKSKNGLKSWIYNYPEKGFRFLDESSYKNSKKVISSCGKVYNSINNCAKEIGIRPSTLKNWIKNYPEKGYKYI